MDLQKKCVRIHVEFSDGSTSDAEQEHADEVWSWYQACEMYAIKQGGAQYDGKPMVQGRYLVGQA